MSDPFFNIPENCFQFMHQMPMFDLEQKQRFDVIKGFLEKLKASATQFEKYSKLGLELVSILKSTQLDLQRDENYHISANLSILPTKMKQISDAFSAHFQFVSDKISKPLQKDVAELSEELFKHEKDFSSKCLSYRTSEEKYVSLSPTVREQQKTHRGNQMIYAHTQSSLSFYDLYVQMELFDRKMKYLIPKIVSFLRIFVSFL